MSTPSTKHEAQRGYPLGALFVLTAASAILVAMVSPVGKALSKDGLGGFELAMACVTGSVVGLLTGAVIGLHQLRKVRGLFCGLLAGAVIGAIAGGICMVPVEGMPAVLYASLGGSAILVAVGAALRFTSNKT